MNCDELALSGCVDNSIRATERLDPLCIPMYLVWGRLVCSSVEGKVMVMIFIGVDTLTEARKCSANSAPCIYQLLQENRDLSPFLRTRSCFWTTCVC